jgi:uncharacterized protein (DUF1800 family)
MFGPRNSEIYSAASRSLGEMIAMLLQDQPTPSPPVDPTTGQTWVTAAFNSTADARYEGYLTAWWIGLMVSQGISIREKMVLFWHNHFVSEYSTARDSRYMYQQNVLFRRYALGNVKDLVKAATQDPAMLIYLNGANNRGNGNNIPDENYARELQELFTIGKGPEAGPGDYTNYTEQDVRAAAHLLTGWRTTGYRDAQGAPVGSYFDPTRHDTQDKLFSAAYQNTRIVGGTDGLRELSDLVEMMFRQQETAKFLCRKLYRWFVYHDIDPTIEAMVIAPLADVMRQSNYEVKPVLEALFRSAHFFDDSNVGCLIKNPIDLVAGAFRTLEIPVPSPDSQAGTYYSLMSYLRATAGTLQMDLMEPPNVAGWPAYYQSPDFHRLWINTVTLPTRWKYTDALVDGTRVGSARFAADAIALAAQASNPGDPYGLVGELAGSLFSIDLTASQRQYLVLNVLMPDLPDYEWTSIWITYAADPNNAQKRNAAASRLNTLLKFMMRMAEFELS